MGNESYGRRCLPGNRASLSEEAMRLQQALNSFLAAEEDAEKQRIVGKRKMRLSFDHSEARVGDSGDEVFVKRSGAAGSAHVLKASEDLATSRSGTQAEV